MDILCLSETLPSDYIFDKETLPAGYTIHQRDRLTRGGGLLVAVHNSISSWLVSAPLDLEVVTVGIQLQQMVILSCVYVPPSASLTYMVQLCSYLSSLVVQNSVLVVVGDFNLPHIDWSTLQGLCPSDQAFCGELVDIEQSLGTLNSQAPYIVTF